jgi:hypothetical protein
MLRCLHVDFRFVMLCLFSYNPSIAICWKGCDYATGRVNDPQGRE